MKITADTNVLIRAVVRDDVKQAAAATKLLREAEIIAVSLILTFASLFGLCNGFTALAGGTYTWPCRLC